MSSGVVDVTSGGEIVKRAEFAWIRGRPKHEPTYAAWFAKVLELKNDEALKIKLDKKSSIPLPSPAAVRFAVERWNRENPDKRIGKVLRDSHSDEPIIYLFPLKEGEELPRKKSKRA